MKLKDIIEAWILYPAIMSVITLIFLIVCWIHRDKLKPFIYAKFRWLKPNKASKSLSLYCQDVKHIIQLKTEFVIDDNKQFIDCMKKFVAKEKKAGHAIIFDMTNIEKCNEQAKEGLRSLFRTIIDENNIRALLFFPEDELQELYSDIKGYIKDKNSQSIEVKRGKKALKSI